MIEDIEIADVTPSWWGKLPLPPVRPRYVVASLTGYTTAGGPGNRKPRTTWTVLDKLNQSKPVGLDHFVEEYAEAERADFEAAWEHCLATGEWVEPSTERQRLYERNERKTFRPWCPICNKKSPPGARRCSTCNRVLYP